MSAGAFSRKRAMAILRSRPFLTVAIVALVWVVAGFASRGFGSYGHLRYLIELAAVIGLVAAGQTFVVIAGGIDLSVAAIVTVSAVGLPLLTWDSDPTGITAIIAVLAVTTAIGLVNGLGVALLRVHPMIMTLAMATFLQGLLIIIAGGSAITGAEPAGRLARQRTAGRHSRRHPSLAGGVGDRALRHARDAARRPHLRHRRQSAGGAALGRPGQSRRRRSSTASAASRRVSPACSCSA